MATPIPQLFGLIPTGSPCIVCPTSSPTPTSFLYLLPISGTKPFSHITIFLLPGITLPPDTAAAVYISLPQANGVGREVAFKFLGGIGEGKESAVFKVSGLLPGGGATDGEAGNGEIDMDTPEATGTQGTGISSLTIGISLEPSSSVAAQMASLSSHSSTNPSSALVLSRPANKPNKPDTLILAQRIIKNAFNFLTSFSGNVNGGVEVVPLKAFEEWWRKFEGKVRSDPGFLERSDD